MKLSLRQNANSFLEEALKRAILAEEDAHHWKFAVLSVVQALELILKERLRQEHPALIFSNIDDQRHTVSIERAAERLKKIAGIRISEADMKGIRTAAGIRNSIVHHEFELNPEHVRSIFGRLLGCLFDFYHDHFLETLAKQIPEDLWIKALEIRRYMDELEARVRCRIKEQGSDEKFMTTCPKCWQDTFCWDPKIEKCHLCGHAEEVAICQECGLITFKREVHTVYYGKWARGDGGGAEDWYPDLCGHCFESYIFDEKNQSSEFISVQ
ncbi:hypothetical protein ACM79C_06150 [Pseudomonas aeruginosa]|nr:hypothetical protein [Pseudomonas aeruginosa]